MSSVKSRNTKPELVLRKELWSRGLRYRINYKSLIGKPDIVFIKAKVAVFCDGDFWHGNNWSIRGLSSKEEELSRYNDYWRNKILKNIERDVRVSDSLKEDGWKVLRFWESDIKKDVVKCADVIQCSLCSK